MKGQLGCTLYMLRRSRANKNLVTGMPCLNGCKEVDVNSCGSKVRFQDSAHIL